MARGEIFALPVTCSAGKTSTVVRLLPAGDEHLPRGALAALPGLGEGELVVVAEAAAGPEAPASTRARRPRPGGARRGAARRPDVAVPELQMPGADGPMM